MSEPLSHQEVKVRFSACSKSGFDGHSNFAALSPEQRLEWLELTARFVYRHRGLANGKPKELE